MSEVNGSFELVLILPSEIVSKNTMVQVMQYREGLCWEKSGERILALTAEGGMESWREGCEIWRQLSYSLIEIKTVCLLNRTSIQ